MSSVNCNSHTRTLTHHFHRLPLERADLLQCANVEPAVKGGHLVWEEGPASQLRPREQLQEHIHAKA